MRRPCLWKVPWKPCLVFGLCCLCWGAKGGWGGSLGGVCYQGTGPNSCLILELLERKSRGLTFPAGLFFLLFWKYTFAGKCRRFPPSETQRNVAATRRHAQEKRPSQQFKGPVSFLTLGSARFCCWAVAFCVSLRFLVLEHLRLHVINLSWTVLQRGYL